MAWRKFGCPLIGKLACRSERAGMVDQCVAKADPKLGIARIFSDGVLEDSDLPFRIARTSQGVGDCQPPFLAGEITEEFVPEVRQRDGRLTHRGCSGRSGKRGMALQGIAGAAEQHCGGGKHQEGPAHAKQPQGAYRCSEQQGEDDPAVHAPRPDFSRLRASQAPPASNIIGASHSGQVSGSAGGLKVIHAP